MKIRIKMYLMLLLGLLSGIVPSATARIYNADDCCARTCCEPEYDCGCPLNCGSLNIWLRGGVAPLNWRGRGDFSAVSCNALAIPGFSQAVVPLLSPLPSFKKFFHVPWTVGGQIGYAVTDSFEFYLAFDYRSASRRNNNNATFFVDSITIPNDVVSIGLTLNNNYRAFDAYIGARYYWGRYWCDRLAFFLGGQFGLVHHKSICFTYAITSQNCANSAALISTTFTPLFFRNTRPAAGLNVGIDWCWGCGWSFMIMGEIVASCGQRGNSNILIASNCTLLPSILPSNLIVGGTGTELFFPVTFGLKYSF